MASASDKTPFPCVLESVSTVFGSVDLFCLIFKFTGLTAVPPVCKNWRKQAHHPQALRDLVLCRVRNSGELWKLSSLLRLAPLGGVGQLVLRGGTHNNDTKLQHTLGPIDLVLIGIRLRPGEVPLSVQRLELHNCCLPLDWTVAWQPGVLQQLVVDNCPGVTDSVLAVTCSALRGIRSLTFRNQDNVGTRWLVSQKLPDLRQLEFWCCPSADGVGVTAVADSLQILRIVNKRSGFDLEGLWECTRLTGLRTLHLSTPVFGKQKFAVPCLKHLTQLENLVMRNVPLSAGAVLPSSLRWLTLLDVPAEVTLPTELSKLTVRSTVSEWNLDLSSCSSLREIHLFGGRQQDVEALLRSPPSCRWSSLEKLHLQRVQFAIVRPTLQRCTGLKELVLDWIHLGQVDHLPVLPSLRYLKLDSCWSTGGSFSDIFLSSLGPACASSLRRLEIWTCRGLTSSQVKNTLQLLPHLDDVKVTPNRLL